MFWKSQGGGIRASDTNLPFSRCCFHKDTNMHSMITKLNIWNNNFLVKELIYALDSFWIPEYSTCLSQVQTITQIAVEHLTNGLARVEKILKIIIKIFFSRAALGITGLPWWMPWKPVWQVFVIVAKSPLVIVVWCAHGISTEIYKFNLFWVVVDSIYCVPMDT